MVDVLDRRQSLVSNTLTQLQLDQLNQGVCSGPGGWTASMGASVLDSVDPSTREVLASVRCATAKVYARVIADALEAFRIWSAVPAPKRGEVIRRIGEALREKKDALGSMISLETGKIKQEGDGEVQEMIDISDFAAGQSRML